MSDIEEEIRKYVGTATYCGALVGASVDIIDRLRAEVELARAVVEAARAWREMKKPVAFTAEEWNKNTECNMTTDSEIGLSVAIVTYDAAIAREGGKL